MAIIYQAELHPTKSELIADWLPRQRWVPDAPDLRLLGSFRFDDPDGEVGLETHLVQLGHETAPPAVTAHVPLTYRGAPLDGGEPGLLGTMEHSVLGTRWIYDAACDPVYWTALAAAILDRMPQAGQFVVTERGQERIPDTVRVDSTGTVNAQSQPIREVAPEADGAVARISAGDIDLSIFRLLGDNEAIGESTDGQTAGGIEEGIDEKIDAASEPVLLATWQGRTARIAQASLH